MIKIESRIAGPWTRFLARTVDYSIWSFVFGILFSLTSYGKNFVESFNGEASAANMAFFIIFMPIYFLLDSFISSIFKNNIGNKIAGIKIVREGYLPDNINFYLKRNFLVWFKGFGMCIPIIGGITQLVQLHYARKNIISSWDQSLSSYVNSERSSSARNIIMSLIIAFFYVFNFAI